MRTVGTVLLAVVLGTWGAWATTRYEFRNEERPLAALGATGQGAAELAPRARVVNSETYDFGTMDVNATLSHTFLIRNDGSAPLVLTKGNTSCKCTLSELGQGEVPPGQEAEVTLEWHPPAASDEFEQSAEIRTNDPQRPLVRLVVRGRVLDALRLDPATLVIGDVAVTESARFEAVLWSYRPQPLELVGHTFTQEATSRWFKLATEPVSAEQLAAQRDARSGVRLVLTVEPGLPLGPFKQKVQLRHNYEAIEPLDWEVTGRGVGDITVIGPNYQAERDFVDIGSVRSGAGRKEKLYLLVKGARRESIHPQVAAVDPAESLRVTIGEPSRPSPKSLLWPLEIEIPATAEPFNRLGSDLSKLARVTLSTGDSVTPEIVLRLRVAVVPE